MRLALIALLALAGCRRGPPGAAGRGEERAELAALQERLRGYAGDPAPWPEGLAEGLGPAAVEALARAAAAEVGLALTGLDCAEHPCVVLFRRSSPAPTGDFPSVEWAFEELRRASAIEERLRGLGGEAAEIHVRASPLFLVDRPGGGSASHDLFAVSFLASGEEPGERTARREESLIIADKLRLLGYLPPASPVEGAQGSIALARASLAWYEGLPLGWPADLPASYAPSALEERLEAELSGAGAIELAELDCEPFPCVGALRSSEGVCTVGYRRNAWQVLLALGYGPEEVEHLASEFEGSGGSEGGGVLVAFALLPQGAPDRAVALLSAQLRAARMLERHLPAPPAEVAPPQ